ncbi:MAG: glycine cleavage system aminomethyltransferase GcvT [Pseudomonadota bacterium]|nr:glycine cleavage system aminomethyltransferase GcvT [Pseudomonadota bacterium]
MAPFAGFVMPIHYALGILGEHKHTRAAAGLFDVSHMGQILLRARSGVAADAARALESLVPVDVLSLPVGRQRYGFFTTESGGIRDDLMIANLGSFLYLVVNAACSGSDLAYLRERLSALCTVEALPDRALLAIQGPSACAALSSLVASTTAMRFMDAGIFSIDGAECFIARSGYTGEDGFEISVPAALARTVAERLLSHPDVQLIGLGARDSLRLEAGLCLYGHDITAQTTPVEAELGWAIQPVRRVGGMRAGGFPGADVILSQLTQGAARRRVGLRPELRPVREGATLFAEAASDTAIGQVTSGTYAPSAHGPVAMGYVPRSAAHLGTRLFADVRGQRTPVTVSEMPFVAHRYHR